MLPFLKCSRFPPPVHTLNVSGHLLHVVSRFHFLICTLFRRHIAVLLCYNKRRQRPKLSFPLSNDFTDSRQGLAGRSNKGQQQQQGKGGSASPTTPYSASPTSQQPPGQPPMPHSPALSSAMSFESQGAPSDGSVPSGSRRPPFFFREEYSNLIVKGNFMTLAAKPKLVEEGEWLAHQGMI